MIGTEQKLFIAVEGSVICYDLISGKMLWETPISKIGDYYDEIWEKEKKGIISRFTVIIRDQLIVGVHQGKVVSLNIDTGAVNWVVSLNNDTALPLIIYVENDNFFYVAANNLFEINFETGTLNQVYQIHEELTVS